MHPLKVLGAVKLDRFSRIANRLLPGGSTVVAWEVMNQPVQLTVPMPANLAKLRFPKALDDRLHYLLDEQGRRGKLTAAEKKEAEGLTELATMLSILKTGAQVRARKP